MIIRYLWIIFGIYYYNNPNFYINWIQIQNIYTNIEVFSIRNNVYFNINNVYYNINNVYFNINNVYFNINNVYYNINNVYYNINNVYCKIHVRFKERNKKIYQKVIMP